MRILSTSVVETVGPRLAPVGVGWSELADSAVVNRFAELLAASRYVPAEPDGAGVCQDFAHVTLALLRAIGLPARYVSGYLRPTVDAEVGETVAGQSHAWVEFRAGDWVALDPTSMAEVGDRHVLLARGRGYADVRPMSGVYSGSAAENFGVTVEVTRLG